MKIYSIFDDFDMQGIQMIEEAGGTLTVHPLGVPRPNHDSMKKILEEYDCVIIGTSQRITEDMFEKVNSPRIIATASVGIDHIEIPIEKNSLVTVINTPTANAQSVAEYTMGAALACIKRLVEGRRLYLEGKNNKALYQKPEDLSGKTIGVIGAGNISTRIMDYAQILGMKVICWTRNPGAHRELESRNIQFVPLTELVTVADVISVNLPNTPTTKGLISLELIKLMKSNAIFISVSRLETVDFSALIQKANSNPGFYVCLDIDVNDNAVQSLSDQSNILITPHIAGGTVETRKRMFIELSKHISKIIACG